MSSQRRAVYPCVGIPYPHKEAVGHAGGMGANRRRSEARWDGEKLPGRVLEKVLGSLWALKEEGVVGKGVGMGVGG